jgi:hypothetical protein
MRAQAVLNCGALRGAAKSHVLAVRIALSVFGSCNGCMRCRSPVVARTRPSGLLAHLRREVVVGGTNWKFERVAWSRSERRAGPVRRRAFALAEAWRREDQWMCDGRAEARQSSPGPGSRETSWMAYGGQKRACALCRAEYVESKDLVNASRWSQD